MGREELLLWSLAFLAKASMAVEQAACDREAGEELLKLAAQSARLQGAVLRAGEGMRSGLLELDLARSWPVCNNPLKSKLHVDAGFAAIDGAWRQILEAIAAG